MSSSFSVKRPSHEQKPSKLPSSVTMNFMSLLDDDPKTNVNFLNSQYSSQTEKKEPKPSGFCLRPTVGVSVDAN